MLCSMYFGLTLCLNDSLRNIKKNLLRFQPAIMVVVPLFVETFYKEITETIRKKRLTIPFAFLRFISFVLKKVGIDVSRRLFKSVHTQFGGNLNLFVCGGAFLDDSKIKFFVGITILQGYGITECSPVVSAQTDRYTRMGAVGKVLPCTKVKIVDGEIAVQGDNVMIGYYKNQPLTDEAIVDGWFYTGDLGHLDEDNFLYLTGRKKNLIILSNGQNVSPEELELKLQNISEIKEALVYGENGQVCAEIFYGEYSADIEETIRVHIGQLMKGWPIYKQIQIIKFRYEEFEKTTTRKIKR